jgi:hypothetical protein
MEVHEKLADGSDMLQDLDEYLEYLNTASNSYDCGLKNPQLCKDEMKRLDFYLLDAVVEQEPAMLTDVGKEVLLRGVLDAKYNRSQKDPETTLIDEIFELGFLEEANFDSQVFAEQKQAWEEQCDDHSGLERDGETYAAKCQKAADFCAAGKPTAAFFNHPQVDAHVDDQINVGKDTIDMWRGCCLCGGGQHQAKWRFTAAADIGGMVGNVVKVERQDIYPQAPNFLWVLLWKVGHEDETPGLFFVKHPDLIDNMERPQVAEDHEGLQNGAECKVKHGEIVEDQAYVIRGVTTAMVPSAFWILMMDTEKADAYRETAFDETKPMFSENCPGLVEVSHKDVEEYSEAEIRARKEHSWMCGQEVKTKARIEVFPTLSEDNPEQLLDWENEKLRALVGEELAEFPKFEVPPETEGNVVRALLAEEYKSGKVPKEKHDTWVFVRADIRDEAKTVPMPYSQLEAVEDVEYPNLRPGQEVEVFHPGGSRLGVLAHRDLSDTWYVKVYTDDEFLQGPTSESEEGAEFSALRYEEDFKTTRPTHWRTFNVDPREAMPVRIEDPGGQTLGAEFDHLHGFLIGEAKDLEDPHTVGDMWQVRVWRHSGTPKDYILPLESLRPDYPPGYVVDESASSPTIDQVAYLADLHVEFSVGYRPGQHVTIRGNSNHRHGSKIGQFREAILIADDTLVRLVAPMIYDEVDSGRSHYWTDSARLGAGHTWLSTEKKEVIQEKLPNKDSHMWLVSLLDGMGGSEPVIVPFIDFEKAEEKELMSDDQVAVAGLVVRINEDINRDAHFGAIVGYDQRRKLFHVAMPLMATAGRFTTANVQKLKREDFQVLRAPEKGKSEKGDKIRLKKDSTLTGSVLDQCAVWAAGQVHGKTIYIAQKACVNKPMKIDPSGLESDPQTCFDYLSDPRSGRALCKPDGSWIAGTPEADHFQVEEHGAKDICCSCGGGNKNTDIGEVDIGTNPTETLNHEDWILVFSDQVYSEKALISEFTIPEEHLRGEEPVPDDSWLRRVWESEQRGSEPEYDRAKSLKRRFMMKNAPQDELHRELLESGLGVENYTKYHEQGLFQHEPGLLTHNLKVSLGNIQDRNNMMQNLAKLAEEGAKSLARTWT